MIPVGEENLLLEEGEIEEEVLPSLTWKLDEARGVIEQKIDSLEALKQALWLTLQTERMEFEIYSADYGAELTELFGQPVPLVYVNLEEAIKEALLQDDRVEAVTNFRFTRPEKNTVMAAFTVITAEGVLELNQEVNLHG